MGHTVYYTTEIKRWDEFVCFMKRICAGLGWELSVMDNTLIVSPGCIGVEPLEIKREGSGFVKTNLVEPCHSIYLLILYSSVSFGSVSVLEDI